MIKRVSAQVYKGGRRRWFTLDAAIHSEALMLIRDAEKAEMIERIDPRDWRETLKRVSALVKIGQSPTLDQVSETAEAVLAERLAREPELA